MARLPEGFCSHSYSNVGNVPNNRMSIHEPAAGQDGKADWLFGLANDLHRPAEAGLPWASQYAKSFSAKGLKVLT